MVKSTCENGSASVAPFLKKCYDMVDDESTDSVISWGKNNDSFVIRDMTEFSVRLLPKYFKHNNVSSFIRQLNIYGFRKIDTDHWEFANEGFIRGRKDLMKTICRRKHTQAADQQKLPLQREKSDEPSGLVDTLWKQIENLKTDKYAVSQELVKLGQNQESAENKLLVLKDQIHGMEKNEQQMLSFLVMVMQNPSLLFQFLQPKDDDRLMAVPSNMLEPVCASNGMIVRYQPPHGGLVQPEYAPAPNPMIKSDSGPFSEDLKEFFISSDFLKVLMDEQLCSSENQSPFILPDAADDNSWEQLLRNPVLENIEDSELDTEEPIESGVGMPSYVSNASMDNSQNFAMLVAEMEKAHNHERKPVVVEDVIEEQNLEILTEQMELLASDPKQKRKLRRDEN